MIVIGKKNNVILSVGEMAYWDNEYPIVGGIAFCPDDVLLFDVKELPPDFDTYKYCYTEEAGFYKNPKYVIPNPYGIPDELVEQIKDDAVAEIEEAVINGTDE